MSEVYQLRRSFKVALDNAMQAVKDKLGHGSWQGEPAGKILCGEVRGLNKAWALFQAEYAKIEKLEDDEDDEP